MTDVAPRADTAPPKIDPESLVLRAAPAPVTRFRRGTVVAIAGLGAIAIIGVSWLALGRPSSGTPESGEDRAPVAAKAASEVLAGAPKNYGEVPLLGPPLPGDFGRPILNHQREMEMAGVNGTTDDAAVSATQAAEAERQRLAAEERAARESGVMLQNMRAVSTPSTARAEAAGMAVPAAAERPDGGPGGTERKAGSAGQPNDTNEINPHRLVAPVSPWIVQAGSVIAASLITGLNSDLPGLVTAQVTENVYDSITGRTLLIPQGARLIGSYDSVVAFGQSRALVVWHRIILPDGSSLRIDNVPATDTAGYAGLSDRIDRHGWQLLKGVVLSTLLGVGTEIGWGSSESDLVRAIRESSQQSGARAGDQIVARSLGVQPTLRVRPGWPLRIVVHKDLILRPWSGGEQAGG
ncbi:MAG TPA: TrbI/VirB10 family protein [Sphingopyxis sp.]|nr:TrbI/VirB10 family protein [Sphingopyxis sp.]